MASLNIALNTDIALSKMHLNLFGSLHKIKNFNMEMSKGPSDKKGIKHREKKPFYLGQKWT